MTLPLVSSGVVETVVQRPVPVIYRVIRSQDSFDALPRLRAVAKFRRSMSQGSRFLTAPLPLSQDIGRVVFRALIDNFVASRAQEDYVLGSCPFFVGQILTLVAPWTLSARRDDVR
ncbi:hypothetical protein A5661_24970 [Mycobacterium asiaticum]|nr:hypothetical protein A5661_24970 [Mycobacterium asiaticum]